MPHLADSVNMTELLHFHFNFLPLHAASIFIITISLRGYWFLIKLYWVIIQRCHFCLTEERECNWRPTSLFAGPLRASRYFCGCCLSQPPSPGDCRGDSGESMMEQKENERERMRRKKRVEGKKRERESGVSATQYPRHERLIRLIDPA